MPRSKKTYESLQANATPVVPIGKEQSFDYFFRQYYAALCFFAQSIIHNQEDAKDIVQDCFIKLWDDYALESKTDTIKSFLYTMVRNRCIDYVRKKKVVTKATAILKYKEEETEYFDELAFAEMMRQVMEHIEQLPANMRNILKEYYIVEKKYKQIAKELATTPDAVRMHKTRAIKLLKEKLLLMFITISFIFLLS